jgi:hypothetical protein
VDGAAELRLDGNTICNVHESLLVDLLHNLDRLAEDKREVLPRVLERARRMDSRRLSRAVREFGSARAERLLEPVLENVRHVEPA